MMIRPFCPEDFPILESWVTSPQLLFQFSADTFSYPLQLTDMQAHGVAHPDRKFYMMASPGLGDFGFGEIIPQPGTVPRLGRLLIGQPLLRGKGLGKALVSALLNECRQRLGAAGAELYVLTDNIPAIKCYTALGFKFMGSAHQLEFGNGITMKKMRLDFNRSV